ncbi:suppressor of SWI4 1 homolog isoform X1 [Hydra vulgaris]|uniref:Suppressor of SWI4 1 homolog n=1 Tax=Hydra vulgaris TaxID=6087 RepID=T2M5F1_HYDVU|nr:suppressor of SWI4 1 homolog [Hydra vulgaris]
MGRSSKKKKKTVKPAGEITDNSIPRSFVFNRGEVGVTLQKLIKDIRRLMEPYTATNLKVTKSNVLKDFVHIAGPYGISHFIIFSKTEKSPYMKIVRLPRGPTLTFRINEYSLMKDITSILRRPKTIGQQFKFPPLVVMNNFATEAVEMKLMTTVFQNMFPSIKVQKVKLAEIRRCAMFNFDQESGCIDFRHYNIEAIPVGISKGVMKLMKNKIPNLSSLNDISDLVTGAAYLSESEGEEPTDSHVTLPQRLPGRGNTKSGQSAVKLTELGPRLKLELLKIEEGVSGGEVLYHKYIQKSEEEIKQLKKKKEKERSLKQMRKKQQEANVIKKEKEKEENKSRSLAGMKRKAEDVENNELSNEEDPKVSDSEDDDVEYFKKEVGEEPEQDLLKNKPKKRKITNFSSKDHQKEKKRVQSFKSKKKNVISGKKVKNHQTNKKKQVKN